MYRENSPQPGRKVNEREREKICHICQTQRKSSKRARNVKLMALNLHRNRRRHKQQQKKKLKKNKEENKTLNGKSHKHTGNIFIITANKEQTKKVF